MVKRCVRVAIFLCVYGPLVAITRGQNQVSDTTAVDKDMCSLLCDDKGSQENPVVQDGRSAPCDNFYRHICTGSETHEGEESDGVEESDELDEDWLKKKLYQKIKVILESDRVEALPLRAKDNENLAEKDVKTLAVDLYKACIADQGNKNLREVKAAVKEMLTAVGLDSWPYTNPIRTTYKKLLEKTGLRPLASIVPVPDKTRAEYLLAINIPWSRFSPYPNVLAEKEKYRKQYTLYLAFLQAVVKMFFEENEHQAAAHENSEYAVPDCDKVDKEAELKVVCDIIEVETALAEMAVSAGRDADYEQRTVGAWESAFDNKIPFLKGLKADIDKAKLVIRRNSPLGLHLKAYFTKLSEFLVSIDVSALANYNGWFFIRELSDVLPENIRQALHSWLKTTLKPNVPVQLNTKNCIEKLIGYRGAMEKAVAHFYLKNYFDESSKKEVSNVALAVTTTFEGLIERLSWMDEITRSKMQQWMKHLQLRMGAPQNLYDDGYIKSQYDLVDVYAEGSALLLFFFGQRENIFRQKLKTYRKPYSATDLWEVSPLETKGTYSRHYRSIEMPAGVLQKPVFEADAPLSHKFGSTGTLVSEILSFGFREEGDATLLEPGVYTWSKETKEGFQRVKKCLRKKTGQGDGRSKGCRVTKDSFERKADSIRVPVKFDDHVGLRTSYMAFQALISLCKKECAETLDERSLKKLFFKSYAQRHCGVDDFEDSEARVNYALSTYSEFAKAFRCKNGQRMKGKDECNILPRSQDDSSPSA